MTQQAAKAVSMEVEMGEAEEEVAVDRGFPPWPVRTLIIWLLAYLLLSSLISVLAGVSFGLVSIWLHLELTLTDKTVLADLALQVLYTSGVFLFLVSRVQQAGFSLRHLWGDHAVEPGHLGIAVFLGVSLAFLAALASRAITGEIALPPSCPMTIDWRPMLCAQLLVNGFMVSVAEEMFFRGLLYRALRHRTSTGWAVLITALIFAAFHPELIPIPVRLLFVFFFGLIAALLLERTRSLSTCISFHFSFNAVAYTMYYLIYFAPAQS